MKNLLNSLILFILIISCGNPSESKMELPVETDETKESPRAITQDNDRVSGSFMVTVGEKKYQSTQLQDNYCDMSFSYSGEKSFVVIRLKDNISDDALLINLYGDENFIDNPEGKLERFMLTSKEFPKAQILFLPHDNEMGSLGGIVMAEGALTTSEFDKGRFIGSFDGLGGRGVDVMKKENLITFEGIISLETKNVTIIGKD